MASIFSENQIKGLQKLIEKDPIIGYIILIRLIDLLVSKRILSLKDAQQLIADSLEGWINV